MQEFSAGVQRYIDLGAEATRAEAARRAEMRACKFDTIAVHGLYSMEAALANQGSIIEPAYFSSAQHFESSDHMEAALAYVAPSWTYSRIANPTLHYLEETLALLEGYGFPGEVSACTTGSGMAATYMATTPFIAADPARPRPNIVASARCYGGTFMLFSRYARERGIEVRWVWNPLDLDEWRAGIDEHTRFVFGEMPSNPGLAMFDLRAVAEMAHAYQIPLIVDSTIATPALLRPMQHGADIVVHSLSKLMGSSGFAIAGALAARHDLPARSGAAELRANFAAYTKLYPLRDIGPSISPFNALMIINDLRTLRGKIDRMSVSAVQVADFLAAQPAVEQVAYPGLPSQPGHELAQRYLWLADGADDYGAPVNRYGYLMSFNVRGGAEAARRVFDGLRLIWRATDLGRVKSVAAIPTISTHQQQGEEVRRKASLPPNLIRLSIGLEHPADLMADLRQALARA